MMGSGMYGAYSLWGILLNIFVILLIVGIVVLLLNRSEFVSSGNNERLARLEKDVDEIKRTVQAIKEKLDEI
jgi:Tfp pilus assembly protein PilO